jgi:uncharacterized RDD family membrane protein YckC
MTAGDPAVDRAAALFYRLAGERSDEPRVGDLGDRAWARVIDTWIAGALFAALAVVSVIVASPFVTDFADPGPGERVLLRTMGFVAYGAWLFALAAWEVLSGGRTLGKRRSGLFIVDWMTRRPATRRQLAKRFAVLVLPPALALFVPLALNFSLASLVTFATLLIPAWAFRDNDRRGLHDHVAGTVVVTPRD